MTTLKSQEMRTLSLEEMEKVNGEGWGRCLLGIGGGALSGFAGATGNGVAFALGPIGVTWGAIGAVGGAIVGVASACLSEEMSKRPEAEWVMADWAY